MNSVRKENWKETKSIYEKEKLIQVRLKGEDKKLGFYLKKNGVIVGCLQEDISMI